MVLCVSLNCTVPLNIFLKNITVSLVLSGVRSETALYTSVYVPDLRVKFLCRVIQMTQYNLLYETGLWCSRLVDISSTLSFKYFSALYKFVTWISGGKHLCCFLLV